MEAALLLLQRLIRGRAAQADWLSDLGSRYRLVEALRTDGLRRLDEAAVEPVEAAVRSSGGVVEMLEMVCGARRHLDKGSGAAVGVVAAADACGGL